MPSLTEAVGRITTFVRARRQQILGGVLLGSAAVGTAAGIKTLLQRRERVRPRRRKRRAAIRRRRRTRIVHRNARHVRVSRRRRKRERITHRRPRHRGHRRVSFTTKEGKRVSFLVRR